MIGRVTARRVLIPDVAYGILMISGDDPTACPRLYRTAEMSRLNASQSMVCEMQLSNSF